MNSFNSQYYHEDLFLRHFINFNLPAPIHTLDFRISSQFVLGSFIGHNFGALTSQGISGVDQVNLKVILARSATLFLFMLMSMDMSLSNR